MAAEYSKLFVVLMGIGTVFFGLICIIFLTAIMGKIMSRFAPPAPPAKAASASAAGASAPRAASEAIEPGVLAAILAALSEDPGISSHGWNITSIKKSV